MAASRTFPLDSRQKVCAKNASIGTARGRRYRQYTLPEQPDLMLDLGQGALHGPDQRVAQQGPLPPLDAFGRPS